MKARLFQIIPNLLVFLIGASVFAFIFFKSSTASFTHDESFTYLHYPHASFQKIISFSDSYTNNHILNSLFMKYMELLLGSSEIALRLPNLMLLIVFMVYGFLMIKAFNPWIKVPLFVILISNMLMIDLFGIARGYGLSIGFMVIGIFHFLRLAQYGKSRDLIVFHLTMLLASLASFTMLTVYGALVIIYFLLWFIKSPGPIWPKKVKSIRWFLIPMVFTLAILYEPVRRVITYNKMDFGGGSGFYTDTVKHLIINLFQGTAPASGWLVLFQLIITILVLFGLVIVIKNLSRRSVRHDYPFIGLTVFNFLLILLAAIFILQHHLIGTSYPISRFSVFLVPVFVLYCGFLIAILKPGVLSKAATILLIPLALTAIAGFVSKADFNSFGEWGYDANTKIMLYDLETIAQPNSATDEKITLGVNWLFEPTINFYRETRNITWLDDVTRDGFTMDQQYFYILETDLNELPVSDYEIVRVYKDSNSILIKNTAGK
jgi:hypothetical protein